MTENGEWVKVMASRHSRRGCMVGEFHTMYMGAAQAHHTPHESAQRRHAQQGQAQQVHATRAWEAQARIPQACTPSACTAGTRNASMGDTSTTTQACTAPAQSTARCTPAMSTTLTSGRRTIWANAAQVHHTPSTRVHSSSTHRMGTRSRHGLEHAPVDDKLGAAAMPPPTSAA